MSNFVQDQTTLYNYFGFPQPVRPSPIDRELMAMRLNFLLEELMETAEGAGFVLDHTTKTIRTSDECKGCEKFGKCDNLYDGSPSGLLAPCTNTKYKFFPKSENELDQNPVTILDGLVDLLVVLLGTAFLMGFLREKNGEKMGNIVLDKTSIFEEAWNRIFKANMAKVVGSRPKRGHSLDLRKPEGWKSPILDDLVAGWWGKCKDCQCNLTKKDREKGNLKCPACDMAG